MSDTTAKPKPQAPEARADFPFPRDSRFDLPQEFITAQAECPVLPVRLWNGQDAWVLTKYEDLCQVLIDDRFSGRFGDPDFPSVTEARRSVDRLEKSFVGMDNPDHDHFRRMVTKEFTTKRMLALTGAVERMVEELFDQMEAKGSPVDFIETFAVELPALVMCELFGSPYEDHSFIARCAVGRHGLGQSTETANQAAHELVDYCRRLIATKEAAPADDMLSRIIRDQVLPGNLDREALANMCAMILRAGHDTTVNMLGLGTLLLLQNPDELEKLKRDPDLVDSAVEEMLRYLTPVQYSPRRVAKADVDLRGQTIRKGDGVFASCPIANRDPDEFEDPHRFDISRDASTHLAFGYGIHRCLGQQLARVELRVAFRRLFERFPTLYLAEPIEDVRFKYDSQIYGLHRLMLGW